MRQICYFNLATFSKKGGIENFNKTFLQALNDLCIQSVSVSVYDKENKSEYANITFKNFNTDKLAASLYVLSNIYNFDRLILAHINLIPIAIIAKILNPKIKIYLSIYGIEVWKKISWIKRKFIEKFIKIFSISSYTTKLFKNMNNMNEKSVFYLAPGINLQTQHCSNNPYMLNCFNILSVTRLDKNDDYKGVDSVIKTISFLIKKIPNLRYTIIGKGNDKERLEKLANDLNVLQYIEFKGFVENIEPYYQYCDIFILPSKGEGFGIVYIEAMKYKKPCIACDEGGQTDVVLDNKTGYLCKYDDIECLGIKIIDLYKDEKKRKLLGENGYKYLLNNFTFEKFQKRLKDILNDSK